MNAPIARCPRKRTATPSSGEHDDSSTSSDAIDSMRPVAPKPRKRRRTITDAFNSIQLRNESDEDADSSQAVGGEDNGYSTSSSLEDDEDVQDERETHCHHELLSDQEEAKLETERKIMLELVFGPNDPVERKFKHIVQQTILEKTNHHQRRHHDLDAQPCAEDDINLPTPYGRSTATNVGIHNVEFHLPTAVKRVTSLPNVMHWEDVNGTDDAMDMSDD